MLPKIINSILPLQSVLVCLRYELPAPAPPLCLGETLVSSHQWFSWGAQGHWAACLLQRYMCLVLASVLSAAPASYQSCILTALPWKSVLYRMLRLLKDNLQTSFLFFLLRKRILSWWSYRYSCFSNIKKINSHVFLLKFKFHIHYTKIFYLVLQQKIVDLLKNAHCN